MIESNPPDDWLKKITAVVKQQFKKEVFDGQPAKPFVPPPVDSGYFSTYGFEEYLKLCGSPQPEQDDLKGSAKELYHQVRKWTELSPIHAEERDWAGIKLNQLAEAVGVSTKQIHRIAKKPPFRTVTKIVDGRTRKLIRICPPFDLTHEDFARIMVADWRETTGRTVQSDEFGLLVGMAKDTPRGLAPDILRTVVANWSSFMAGVHYAINIAAVDGDAFDSDPEHFGKKYFHHPSISVTRRFWPAALELYHMFIQENLASSPILYSQIDKIMMKHEIQSPF